MIYRLLGELQIGRDGRLLRLPGGPTLLLLAALLLGVNRKMSKTELIRAAWGTDQMSDTQLYKRVKEVRGLLAKIGRDDDLLNHHGFGYELQVADDEIDTLQFERLVRQAHRAGMQDDAEGEIALLRQALGLWRSTRPLSNVAPVENLIHAGGSRCAGVADAVRDGGLWGVRATGSAVAL